MQTSYTDSVLDMIRFAITVIASTTTASGSFSGSTVKL